MGGGDDGDGGGSATVPTTPEGKFGLQSEFDLATNLPGTAGTVAGYIIQATDDPDDPTKFIVDELIKQLPNGTIKNYVVQGAPYVVGYLNDRLLQVAPNFVSRLVDVGNAFGQVAKHFGTHDVLEINAGGQAVKIVDGLHFKIDMATIDLPFKDFDLPDTRIEGLTVTLENSGKLLISEHKVGLKYGQVLKLALDEAIIPFVDPSAHDLGELLRHSVNCTKVGQFVAEAIGFGSPSTFESACNTGLTAAANVLYVQLGEIDSALLELDLTGTARGYDKNGDDRMDSITSGVWTGKLDYAGTPAPLADAKFFGSRL